MRTTFLALRSVLLSSAVAASYVTERDYSVAYADGYLYCRKDNTGQCGGDLGDFPAEKKFGLSQSFDFTVVPIDIITVAEKTSVHHYNVFPLTPYINKSPGAFTPVGFTADNITLKDGETTWGFFDVLGWIMFSPTGNFDDMKRYDGFLDAQEYQLVETSHTDVYQLYWNQTKYDEMRNGGSWTGDFELNCIGKDSDAVLNQVEATL